MWDLLEHRRTDRQLAKAPREVLKRYEKWKGSRASRVGDQWRVIYRVVPERLTYYIESVTPHDYRRP